jgi:nucleotide-binding universal stress UspA family protein
VKILVCVDGSKTAGEALRLACMLVKNMPADITLLHVEKCAFCGLIPSLRNRLMTLGRRGSEPVFRDAKNILDSYGLKAINKIRAGNIESEIVSEANGGEYDLVVFGSQGVKGIEMLFFGALSYRLIEKIKKPLLVVKKGRKKISRMLVCTGGSAQADKAAKFAANINYSLKADVALLHVSDRNRAHELGSSAEVLSRSGQMFTGNEKVEKLLFYGRRSKKILETARRGDYDLIVLGGTSMNSVKLLFSGSVVYDVLKKSKVPCLIVK